MHYKSVKGFKRYRRASEGGSRIRSVPFTLSQSQILTREGADRRDASLWRRRGRARAEPVSKWVKGLVPCGLLGQSPDFSASITGETYRIIKRKSRIVPTRDFLPIQFCFGFIRSVKGCPTAYRTTSLPLDLTCATNCCPIIGFLILFNIFAPKVH